MDLHVEHRPRSRGVSQLMYVGDAETGMTLTKKVQIAGAVALAIGIFGPTKHRTSAAIIGGVLLGVEPLLKATMRYWSP